MWGFRNIKWKYFFEILILIGLWLKRRLEKKRVNVKGLIGKIIERQIS